MFCLRCRLAVRPRFVVQTGWGDCPLHTCRHIYKQDYRDPSKWVPLDPPLLSGVPAASKAVSHPTPPEAHTWAARGSSSTPHEGAPTPGQYRAWFTTIWTRWSPVWRYFVNIHTGYSHHTERGLAIENPPIKCLLLWAPRCKADVRGRCLHCVTKWNICQWLQWMGFVVEPLQRGSISRWTTKFAPKFALLLRINWFPFIAFHRCRSMKGLQSFQMIDPKFV